MFIPEPYNLFSTILLILIIFWCGKVIHRAAFSKDEEENHQEDLSAARKITSCYYTKLPDKKFDPLDPDRKQDELEKKLILLESLPEYGVKYVKINDNAFVVFYDHIRGPISGVYLYTKSSGFNSPLNSVQADDIVSVLFEFDASNNLVVEVPAVTENDGMCKLFLALRSVSMHVKESCSYNEVEYTGSIIHCNFNSGLDDHPVIFDDTFGNSVTLLSYGPTITLGSTTALKIEAECVDGLLGGMAPYYRPYKMDFPGSRNAYTFTLTKSPFGAKLPTSSSPRRI